ncbi:carbohydrate kinase [Flammeovirgaceae bacterium SG7u.111]|nr:carbohydrate kinase [Flammeovirgaceae bacterium SG7u.132]WPO37228.1 carbohydrate kinase [Flammeovirgaceae bacterium SG7u.111]
MKNIVCFGEVLWDMLPTGKKLGGAPLNVALRAQSLGMESNIISAIGNDSIGQEILEELKTYGINKSHIQVSKKFGTSEVLVHLDSNGSASYDIKMPCAWDDIEHQEEDAKTVAQSDAFIHGSLAARSKTTLSTLLQLLNQARFKVFDVNLRPPHYNLKTLLKLMNHADLIKFNDDEIFEICKEMGLEKSSLEECVQFIAEHTQTKQICVTLGGNGAVLYIGTDFFYNKGYKVKVADTVGAGDSFLATIISELLNETPPQRAINSACAIGALVASKNGANPKVTQEEIEKIML